MKSLGWFLKLKNVQVEALAIKKLIKSNSQSRQAAFDEFF